MTKCLVTGACGFMGTHMVEVLKEAGHDVRATDLPSAYVQDDKKLGRFPSVLKKLNVEFVGMDLANPSGIEKLVQGCEYIFHIAAVFSYSAPWKVLYKVNVEGTKNLLDALVKNGKMKRFVLWGAGGRYAFSDKPMKETDPINPPNDYQKSKSEQEALVKKYAKEHNFAYTVILPTSVYGPRGVYGAGKMLMDFAKPKTVMIPRSFTMSIPFIHVRDVCRAALYLAQKEEAANQDYNFDDGNGITAVETARLTAEATGKKFKLGPNIPVKVIKGVGLTLACVDRILLKLFKKKPNFEKAQVEMLDKKFVYDISKLKSTGYKFEYPDTRVGIKETTKWYKEQGWI